MVSDTQRWNEYHQKTQDGSGPSMYGQEREPDFPRNSIICDLGGGTGSDTVYFLKKGHKVILADISDHALKVAQGKVREAGVSQNLELRQIDYWKDKINLPDESVDVVYSRQSLHYFPKDETGRLFKEVYRILKKGGKAYITLKSPEDTVEMSYLKETSVEYEPNVFIKNDRLKSRFSIDQLKEILNTAGILDSQVTPYKERVPSGNEEIILNEVIFVKQ
ncbi:hypothetical protein A3D00_05595 [Candidatus Woesebacteria bacterium RIFCSPHIGHO2_02_FULL_38_9]|uniref:Methyltransferase domain-containing protein n=1 Tax=Candidatus Woesebacteria bacterium RIFCSPHIGHO2_01_FULL_39_28 TaxID=1802496 RepID=A0A1F7YIJ3_9BACT|nr:MAG: hypothetical protein A2627_05975 [Candidatus Woesebacteria bacterium RIFCSPHIGHO2_01_FULL_39_28]OGM32028.1 MAG: hypothetical protein A3D00_05595 [Candidatus Woesebacteria bacterium RIFCSPHIGHO2_02_FULL_38_9]OGM57135.1 MAG: hypothetical protein A3A50_00385 [Candidatus Woesebacteria bacterium RIFCSPLOWO2_01_FULL_38_20]